VSGLGAAQLALGQLLALLILAASSSCLGVLLVRRLEPLPPMERWAFATGAGLGGLATILLALGALGRLTPGAVWLLALGCVISGAAWHRRRTAAFAPARRRPRPWALVLWAAAFLPAFLLTLYPPVGFDEIAYHLPFAAAFARAGRLVIVPEHLFPVFPQLAELLFTGILLLAGDVATHVVQYLAMLAIAAAVWAAARRYGSTGWAGPLAAALWLSNPLVQYQAGSGYVDLVYSLFVVLGLLAWERWHEQHGGVLPENWRWLAASGLFLGLAADSKYLGLLWLALLAVLTAVQANHQRRRAAARFVAAAAAAMAPWYLRIFTLTHNPVFPLLARWFPGTGSVFEELVGVGGGGAWLRALPRPPLGGAWPPWLLLTLPWRLAFAPASFGRQSPLSPYYLLVLPLMALYAVRDRRLRRWLFLVIAYAMLWTARDPRFQLPSAALLAVGGGICGARLLASARLAAWRSDLRVALVVSALAASGPLYSCYRIAKLGVPPATEPAREAFLSRQLRGYTAVQWLNQHFDARYALYGIGAENLTYYVQGRFLGEVGGPFAQWRAVPLLGQPDRLRRLLECWGADHLLMVGGEASPWRSDLDLGSGFTPVLRGPGFDLFALQPPATASRPATKPMQCGP
jgi:hypothetical protein